MAVTAFDTEESRAAAVAVGCCECVVKPLDFDRLSEILERLLPPHGKAHAAAKD